MYGSTATWLVCTVFQVSDSAELVCIGLQSVCSDNFCWYDTTLTESLISLQCELGEIYW